MIPEPVLKPTPAVKVPVGGLAAQTLQVMLWVILTLLLRLFWSGNTPTEIVLIPWTVVGKLAKVTVVAAPAPSEAINWAFVNVLTPVTLKPTAMLVFAMLLPLKILAVIVWGLAKVVGNFPGAFTLCTLISLVNVFGVPNQKLV
jgi:hypothetical protein